MNFSYSYKHADVKITYVTILPVHPDSKMNNLSAPWDTKLVDELIRV
jgi:hypothetical protein